jgi:hypothetical protein
MRKKRAEVPRVPRNCRLRCLILDTASEALPNDEGYSRQPFGSGSCHAGIGRRQHSELQTKLPRVVQAVC